MSDQPDAGAGNTQTGMVCAILAAACWGVATVMSKAALDGVSPVLLLVLQLVPCVVLLWLVVWVQGIPSCGWQDAKRFAWLGVLEPGLAFLIGLIGLSDMKAGAATLIQSSEAILIVMVSAVLIGTRPTSRFIVLSILAFAGLMLALGISNADDMRGNGIFGISMVFAATATAAVYVVLSSQLADDTHPVAIVAWQQSMSLAFALLVLIIQSRWNGHTPILPDTPQLWLIVLVSGVIQYALAFSLYMRALGSISANVAGTFLNLIPVFGLTGGFLFLGEHLSATQLFGAAITIASVVLISLSASSATH